MPSAYLDTNLIIGAAKRDIDDVEFDALVDGTARRSILAGIQHYGAASGLFFSQPDARRCSWRGRSPIAGGAHAICAKRPSPS